MFLKSILLAALLAYGQFISGGILTGTTPSGENIVNNSSTLSFDQTDMNDVYGFKVQIDGGSYVDFGIPEEQAPHASGGVTFTINVSSLSLTNGAHTLGFCAYNVDGTVSASCPTLNVTKQ